MTDFLWDIANHRPAWWVLLVVGAILGNLLQLIPTTVSFLWRLKKRSAIEGDWYSYHFTFIDGQATTVESKVRVRKSFWHSYVAELNQIVESKLKYKGYVTREKDQLLFVYKSVDHSETVINRFQEPIGKKVPRLYGLWLSYDHSQTIACGAVLLSQNEISETDRTREIAKGYEQPKLRPLTKVKPLFTRVKHL